MDEYLRTFLAIDLPEEMKTEALGLIDELKSQGVTGVKWVGRENLHVTLKFLGEFRRRDIQPLFLCLEGSRGKFAPHSLKINHFGAYPNLRIPRVLWLGFQCPPELNRIFETVEDCVFKMDYEKDARPFSPHLTIGRVKRGISSDETRKLGEALSATKLAVNLSFSVNKITFFQSRLTRSGPIYSELFRINMTG